MSVPIGRQLCSFRPRSLLSCFSLSVCLSLPSPHVHKSSRAAFARSNPRRTQRLVSPAARQTSLILSSDLESVGCEAVPLWSDAAAGSGSRCLVFVFASATDRPSDIPLSSLPLSLSVSLASGQPPAALPRFGVPVWNAGSLASCWFAAAYAYACLPPTPTVPPSHPRALFHPPRAVRSSLKSTLRPPLRSPAGRSPPYRSSTRAIDSRLRSSRPVRPTSTTPPRPGPPRDTPHLGPPCYVDLTPN